MRGTAIAIILVGLLGACGGGSGGEVESPPPDDPGGGGGGGGEDHPPAPTEPTACGHLTCAPDQRCVVQCLCCGMRLPEPGEATAGYECQPLPPECRDRSGPGCERLVERPCA